MRVLVTEAGFGDSDRLVERLRGVGVEVIPCHEATGLCRALTAGGCPLDHQDGSVDLVLDVRGMADGLTAREYGAVCAVRAGVPLRIVSAEPGLPAVAPAGLRTTAAVMTEDEVVGVCSGADDVARATLLGWPGSGRSRTG